jgi:DNA-binding MarR family transcriptional regulator
VVNQEKVEEMIKSKKYTGETLRLLLFFMSVVEYDNRIKAYTQAQIAEKTSMRQPQISRAMKDLEKDEIIIKDGRDYYFSTEFLAKGTFNNRIYETE